MKNWDEFFGGSVDFSGKDTKLRWKVVPRKFFLPKNFSLEI
jgi:hypothetical protein